MGQELTFWHQTKRTVPQGYLAANSVFSPGAATLVRECIDIGAGCGLAASGSMSIVYVSMIKEVIIHNRSRVSYSR